MRWRPWRRRGPDAAQLQQVAADLEAAAAAVTEAQETLEDARRLARERDALLRTEADLARARRDPFAATVIQQMLDTVRQRRQGGQQQHDV